MVVSLTTVLLLVATVGIVIGRPPIITPHGNFSTDPISAEDRERFFRYQTTHRQTYPAGFKYMYVSQDGRISPHNKPAGDWIKIVGSPQSSIESLYVAALEVHRMLRYSPSHIFTGVARSDGGLGVFTAAETITVFPDFASHRDTPECHNRCDGACSRTCISDGRKVSKLAGITSTLATVLADNFMCAPNEGYHHHDNILVHEFAHMVDKRGFSHSEQSQKEAAYRNAHAHNLWRADTYAMSNSAEYFGELTGAFFLVNLQTGGMTDCSHGPCQSEADARAHIRQRDLQGFSLLSEVWTNGHPEKSSGLEICYSHLSG